MILSHNKSRSDFDYSLYKQKNLINQIPSPNLLTPVPIKPTIKHNFHNPNINHSNPQKNKLNSLKHKNSIENDKKTNENIFIPVKRNFNKIQYYINTFNENKTHEIQIQKINTENANNNNNKLILINLMKVPENKSYRIQSSKNNKINIDNNLNSTKNQNINKIKVNFLHNLKQKKNLQHNNSSIYAIPKKITKQPKKQTNINISYNNSTNNYNSTNNINLNNYNSNNNNNNYNTTNSTINNSNIEDEYFDNKNINEKIIELTKEEKEIYGNRIMGNYKKIKLLGKGGCGIVWLCSLISNDNFQCAVKQISKKNILNNFNNEDFIDTGRNEIKILEILNENEGNDKIPKLYNYYEDNNDIWFSFEKCGNSLSNLSFKIKGEFLNNERIYCIQKGIFFQKLFSNITQFKKLVKNIIEGIDYINNKGYIHSDIKPENILIEYEDNENFNITKVKIIDFGSSFYYKNISSISSNTPEYLCPEITNNSKNFFINLNRNNKYINSVDIWSIGITLLELCLGCPIWMSYKAKVIINGKVKFTTGLFGYRGRDGNKIYHKQIEMCKNLNKILKGSFINNFSKEDKENFEDLLEKMICFDYKKRISTKDALLHKFFN